MVPMIEPHPYKPIRLAGDNDNRIDLRSRSSCGLFNKDVLAGLYRRHRDFRQRVICGGNDNDIHIRTSNHFTPISITCGSRKFPGQAMRSLDNNIRARNKPSRRQSPRTLSSDQSTSNNPNIHFYALKTAKSIYRQIIR
jgi:hypothetical protein